MMLHLFTKLNNRRIRGKISRQELPWKTLKNIERPNSSSQLIPKNMYQTWENKLVGKNHFKSIQNFISINDDLSFYYFDKNERDSYITQYWGHHQISEIYNHSKFGQVQADIFRYCILAERGGYYFDISKGCSSQLSKLHNPNDSALISFEGNYCGILPELDHLNYFMHPERYISQWGFGFAPQHLFLHRTIDNICKAYPFFQGKLFSNPKAAIISFSGTGMFTKSVREVTSEGFLGSVCQKGIDFNGHGIFIMPGSHARYLMIPDYADKINEVIVE
ncbi:hypothetical protein ICV00_04735 [Polynucleobacter asymbioticus]|nr:hypothetical protein ICV00_04735 [Polynucleobacter asymbioticus]